MLVASGVGFFEKFESRKRPYVDFNSAGTKFSSRSARPHNRVRDLGRKKERERRRALRPMVITSSSYPQESRLNRDLIMSYAVYPLQFQSSARGRLCVLRISRRDTRLSFFRRHLVRSSGGPMNVAREKCERYKFPRFVSLSVTRRALHLSRISDHGVQITTKRLRHASCSTPYTATDNLLCLVIHFLQVC